MGVQIIRCYINTMLPFWLLRHCVVLAWFSYVKCIGDIVKRTYKLIMKTFKDAKTYFTDFIDPLHKWRLNLNNNTHTSLASHSCKKAFVWKLECEAKDV